MRWGRYARLYVNGTLIKRAKNFVVTDDLEDVKINPREVPCSVHLPGGQDCVIGFSMLDTSDSSYTMLRTAKDIRRQDLVVLLVPDYRRCSQTALRFLGCLLKFQESHPEDAAAPTEVVLANTGLTITDGPTRFAWTNPDQLTCIA